MDTMDNRELISALADGQLQGEDFARAVQAATADAQAREAWASFHLVSEVLRTGRAAPPASSPEVFLSRLQQRLARERAVTAPPVLAPARPVARAGQPAANDWIWKLAAGVASVAAVTAVGWNVWSGGGAGNAQPQLATAPAAVQQVAADPAASPMLRDPRLDRLLAAHRQFGGASVLQTPSGFLRNATFEAPGR